MYRSAFVKTISSRILIYCPLRPNSSVRNICTTRSRYGLNDRLRRIGSISEREAHLRRKDNVPNTYNLIYRAPMESYVSVAKNLTTFSTVIIGLLVADHYLHDRQFIPINMEVANLVSEAKDIWYFFAGFVLIMVTIRVFVSKYPLRIYRHSDSYLAIYDSQLPMRYFHHNFQKSQVKPASSLIWKDSAYALGNRKAVLMTEYFKTPADFNDMIGTKNY